MAHGAQGPQRAPVATPAAQTDATPRLLDKQMLPESQPRSRRLLTLHDTAATLSISVASVRRLITGGHLPCLRFNRHRPSDTKDLEAFVQGVTRPWDRVRGHCHHDSIHSSRKEIARVEE
jgi:hypothetical protein